MKFKLLSVFALSSHIACQANTLPEQLAAPGGVVEIPIGNLNEPAPRAFFQQQRVLVTPVKQKWLALVGIPLETAPGSHQIDVQSGNKHYPVKFTIYPKDYPTQHISLKNQRMVNPEPEDLKRIQRDQQAINQAIGTWTELNPVDLSFQVPVNGRVSGVFGSRRIFNKQTKNPHSGLDLAAPAGTPIKCPAKARVISTGNYYYNGNAVFLDHGQGLISAYFHMTKISVKPGQELASGEIIGTVGATGRVTGPHLHWNIYLNKTKVDPALFISEALSSLQSKK